VQALQAVQAELAVQALQAELAVQALQAELVELVEPEPLVELVVQAELAVQSQMIVKMPGASVAKDRVVSKVKIEFGQPVVNAIRRAALAMWSPAPMRMTMESVTTQTAYAKSMACVLPADGPNLNVLKERCRKSPWAALRTDALTGLNVQTLSAVGLISRPVKPVAVEVSSLVLAVNSVTSLRMPIVDEQTCLGPVWKSLKHVIEI
jgi:hypothetical protein